MKPSKEWFDASSMKLFQLCPRRYFYRHKLHLIPKDGQGTDIPFGVAIHAALEVFYKGKQKGDLNYALEYVDCPHRFPLDSSNDCKFCKTIEGKEGQTFRLYEAFLKNFTQALEKGPKTQVIGLQLLIAYVRKYKDEKMVVKAVEQSFEYQILVPGALCSTYQEECEECRRASFTYVGKIDLWVEWLDNNYIMDHKTAGRFGDMFDQSFTFDLGCTGYIKAFQEKGVVGEIINGIRPTNKIEDDSFKRHIEERQQWELDDWETDVIQTVKEIREAEKNGVWRKHNFACFAYYRECEYRRLCMLRPEKREEEIAAHYTVEEWDPFR